MGSDRTTRVSVIVPTKNRSNLLGQALESIRAIEGSDLQIELIVVDNGSTDDSVKVAHEYGALVLHCCRPGAAAARNIGLRSATGEFVAFLDDDDLFLPGHLRPHIDLLHGRPELSAVVGQIVITDVEAKHPTAPYPAALPQDGNLFLSFLAHHSPQVGATVARTSVRETVGYFDPDVEGDEDWDWHLRLANTHNVGFVPTPCMLFRQSPSSIRADIRWRRLRNNRRVFLHNLRRARPGQHPGLLAATQMFLRHNGWFSGFFAAEARSLAETGDFWGALVAWRRAILASPPHAFIRMITPGRS